MRTRPPAPARSLPLSRLPSALALVLALASSGALQSAAAGEGAVAPAVPVPSPAPLAPALEAPRWSFSIDARGLAKGTLAIEMSLHGFSGPLPLCADMHGAGRSVRELREVSSSDNDAGPGAPLARAPDRADCFLADAPAHGPLVVRYQLDLADLASHHGDPDWASRDGDDYVFNDEAVLLRPDPLPDDAPIELDFTLPAGVSVAAPWRALDRAGSRFASDARQYDAGSYVALGHLRALASIESHGGRFDVVLLGGEHRASDVALRNWVSRAALAVGDFYRGVPSGRALVLLVPVAGSREPGVFGSTLHRAAPSAVLFFGADADDAAFLDDWMPTHELFHVGNPRLTSRVHWFNEGSATYYQDVLRARAGMEPPEKIWSDLYDGFRRFCSPGHGLSLADESERLRERHHYVDVYWGGACLFFRADVLIREHSDGKQSLDDVLRALLAQSLAEPLDESELIDALDRAVGGTQPSEQLHQLGPVPLEALYRKLGIEPVADDRVKLDPGAPEAALRRAILGEKGR